MIYDDDIDFERNSSLNWRELSPDQLEIIDLQSVEEIKSCAQKGDSKAQHYLSVLYTQGTVLNQDFKLAYEWCMRSADQGSTSAMRSLAFLYKG